ncbi:hypothetical protein PT2222_140123 [Paraburkholderia tropica]
MLYPINIVFYFKQIFLKSISILLLCYQSPIHRYTCICSLFPLSFQENQSLHYEGLLKLIGCIPTPSNPI